MVVRRRASEAVRVAWGGAASLCLDMTSALGMVNKKLGSSVQTAGWLVVVEPEYAADRSDPEGRRFVFVYRIQVTNISGVAATLRRRRWLVVDAAGRRTEVEGEGVVGQQPRLAPGQTFNYSSFTPIETAWGTMEGSYQLETDEGGVFEIAVGRFYLVAPTGRTAMPG